MFYGVCNVEKIKIHSKSSEVEDVNGIKVFHGHCIYLGSKAFVYVSIQFK